MNEIKFRQTCAQEQKQSLVLSFCCSCFEPCNGWLLRNLRFVVPYQGTRCHNFRSDVPYQGTRCESLRFDVPYKSTGCQNLKSHVPFQNTRCHSFQDSSPHGNELSDFIDRTEFFEYPSVCWLFKRKVPQLLDAVCCTVYSVTRRGVLHCVQCYWTRCVTLCIVLLDAVCVHVLRNQLLTLESAKHNNCELKSQASVSAPSKVSEGTVIRGRLRAHRGRQFEALSKKWFCVVCVALWRCCWAVR